MTLFAIAAACIWGAAFPLCAFAGSEAARTGLLLGWGFGGLSGLLTFASLVYSARGERRALPIAVVGGFATRLAAALIGLVVAKHFGFDLLAFCLSFFGLYWAFFAIEFFALRGSVAPSSAAVLR